MLGGRQCRTVEGRGVELPHRSDHHWEVPPEVGEAVAAKASCVWITAERLTAP